jgi:hypothetical protein
MIQICTPIGRVITLTAASRKKQQSAIVSAHIRALMIADL